MQKRIVTVTSKQDCKSNYFSVLPVPECRRSHRDPIRDQTANHLLCRACQ